MFTLFTFTLLADSPGCLTTSFHSFLLITALRLQPSEETPRGSGDGTASPCRAQANTCSPRVFQIDELSGSFSSFSSCLGFYMEDARLHPSHSESSLSCSGPPWFPSPLPPKALRPLPYTAVSLHLGAQVTAFQDCSPSPSQHSVSPPRHTPQARALLSASLWSSPWLHADAGVRSWHWESNPAAATWDLGAPWAYIFGFCAFYPANSVTLNYVLYPSVSSSLK